jgi:hypothetical protein
MLERLGYSVLAARSGPAALALLKDHAGPIDLLLTDVVMPHMDGPTLAASVKMVRPRIAVVYMSGYAGEEISRLGLEQAGVPFIHKPFTLEALSVTLRDVLDA